jgi:hypothetical protein
MFQPLPADKRLDMLKLHLLPIAAAALLVTGCSQLHLPFFDGSDTEEIVLGAAETAQAGAYDYSEQQLAAEPAAAEADFAAKGGEEFAAPAGASAPTNTPATSSAPPSADFARVAERLDSLQQTTSALSTDLRALRKEFNAMSAGASADREAADSAAATFTEAAESIASFGDTLAGLDTRISAMSGTLEETRDGLREARTGLRNTGPATVQALAPALENGLAAARGWYRTTLAVVIAGFAALGFMFWRSARSARNSA